MKPSILFHRPGPWHSDVDSSTRILCRRFFEEGYKAAYWGQQLDVGNILRHPHQSWQNWRRERGFAAGPRIVQTLSVFPVRDFFPTNTPAWMRWGYRSALPSIHSQLLEADIPGPDIIWAARPGASVLKSIFPKAKLVMQVVDFYPAFRGDYIRKLERDDYAVADHVLLIGHSLKPYLVDELGVRPDKITVLGQGVSNMAYKRDMACPADLIGITGPIAIWVGVLDKADAQMMTVVARTLHSIGGSLVLIGPGTLQARGGMAGLSNVHFLGSKHPDEVPAYLAHSDFGIMLYDRSRQSVYYGQNPLKLYEYAAAGLSIISTPHEEFKYVKPPVHTCSTIADLEEILQCLLHQKTDGDNLSLEFALRHDWNKVYRTAQSVIDSLH